MDESSRTLQWAGAGLAVFVLAVIGMIFAFHTYSSRIPVADSAPEEDVPAELSRVQVLEDIALSRDVGINQTELERVMVEISKSSADTDDMTRDEKLQILNEL